MRNASRAWAYETGLAAGVDLGPGMFQVRLQCSSVTLPRNSGQRVL